MFELLLAAALSWPAPWYAPGKNPETRVAYEARVVTIVRAVADTTEDQELALAALLKMYHESRFRLDVHDGTRLGDAGNAACLGQLHVSRDLPRADWLGLVGTRYEPTRRCVGATVRLLARYRAWCGSWAGAFSAYATGKGCSVVPLGRDRAERLAIVRGRLSLP